jgi:hypothetical protein
MMTMLATKLLAAAALAAVSALPAQAAEVVWTLQGAAFSDGGTAAGTFTFNADTNTVTNFALSVTGGNTDVFPAFTWDSSTATAVYVGLYGGLNFRSTTSLRELRLDPAASLTNAGGTVALDLGSIFGGDCYNCDPFRAFTSGSLVASAAGVPEPATWGMMLAGFGAVGWSMRRSRSAAAAVRAA